MKKNAFIQARATGALLPLAVAGILAGLGTSCAKEEGAAPAASKTEPVKSAPSADKHACKGMNSCKGQGGCKTGDAGCAAKNSCKGHGGCATAEHHSCKGSNACKGMGGCKTGDAGCAGKNSCKGHGGCAVPVSH